ncbi:MAG: ComEC/Rec2 family competence protein [Armatimonadetes bacterium]|nr:ComEC/Rec2 family competence protein [Armatimonadota bacterium]
MFRRPLFLPLVAWVLGILLARDAAYGLALGLALAAGGLAGTFLLSRHRGALLSMLAVAAGLGLLLTLAASQPEPYDPVHLLRAETRKSPLPERALAEGIEVEVIGRLAADPAAFPNRLAFPLTLESAAVRGETLPVSGKLQVSLYPSLSRDRLSAPPPPASPENASSWTFGDRVHLTGMLRLPPAARNPGEFDYRAYLARNGIHATLSVRGGENVRRVESPGFSWTGLCLAAKRGMETGLTATLPPTDAAVLTGLLFSERRQLPDALVKAFTATGTVHLLSTSGVHVAVLALTLQMLFGRSRRRFRKPFALLSIALLVAFGVMAGMRPAVARAVLMAACVYAADLVDRDADGPNLLCLAALILLALNPLDLYDMSFQLSFAAVAGLMFLMPPIEQGLRRGLKVTAHTGWIAKGVQLLAASLAVEAALGPLLAWHVQQVSLISPLANLVVIPLSAPLIPLGLLQAGVGAALPPAGEILGYAVSGLLGLFTGTIYAFAAVPGATLDVPPPPLAFIGIYYGILLGYARPWALKGNRKQDKSPEEGHLSATVLPSIILTPTFSRTARQRLPRVALYASPVALLLLLFRGVFPAPAPSLRFTLLDVGQGDCLLVQTPDGAAMLVDGGGLRGYGDDPTVSFDVGERIVVPALRRMGVRRLDLVVLSHPHDDHIGGLGAVLESIPVRGVVTNGERGESAACRRLERAIRDRRIPEHVVGAGDALRLGREVMVEAMAPAPPRFTGTRSDTNNHSVVLRLRYRGFKALLTGDIEAEAEARLLPALGRVDLLKVAHHGSRFSTSEAFVERVRPRAAIIGVGLRNNFGHPNPEVVRRLEQNGARVFRTDLHGAVTVETDGHRIEGRTFLPTKDSRPPRPIPLAR